MSMRTEDICELYFTRTKDDFSRICGEKEHDFITRVIKEIEQQRNTKKLSNRGTSRILDVAPNTCKKYLAIVAKHLPLLK